MPTPMQFLRESGVQPLHRRGQNFLIDKNILKKIIEVAQIKKTDTIVEIGSGSGELTAELASRAKKVFAVEIDRALFEILDSRTTGIAICTHSSTRGQIGNFRGNDSLVVKGKNLILIKDDIRAIPNTVFGKKDGSYRVIANIPYHITSQIIRKFLEGTPRPRELVLLMQKEVAKRIVAKPPQMSLLAVSVQYYADVKILFPVSRNSFFPKPNVDSAVVRMVVKRETGETGTATVSVTQKRWLSPFPVGGGNDRRKSEDDKWFFAIVRAGFSAKRKQCAQSISKKLHIPITEVLRAFQYAGVAEKARAQEISVEQWGAIAKNSIIHFTRFEREV